MKLAEDLKAAGAAVWLDQLDIAPGQRWARAVEDALNGCARILVILSPASIGSRNVEDEVSFALEEAKTVIPVMYRDCRILFRLRPLQYVDFRSDYSLGFKTLLRTLNAELLPDRSVPPPRESPAAVSEPDRSSAVLAIPKSQPLRSAVDTVQSPGQEGRRGRPPSGIPDHLNSVAFVNAQTGWAVGGKGIIVHTEDGGKTWNEQTSGTKNVLNSVAFLDAQCGWAVGDYGLVLRTKDGGMKWTETRTEYSWGRLLSIVFADAKRGWAAMDDGTILHTKDEGINWEQQSRESRLSSVFFLNERCGWAVGEEGAILHTPNGGNKWERQTSGTGQWLSSVAFANEQVGCAVGSLGYILRTVNGGRTWKGQYSRGRWLYSVAFVDDKTGWAVGEDGIIVHTRDGGKTWTKQISGFKDNLYSVAFVSVEDGWAAGRNGTILHTDDGGQTWTKQTG